ncbi:uncharacterized protein LOC120528972 [Polypterus senegalus]|uniref:uncharacterized protein LOC120528972 n=1 Tax=Polypterus senegalus TaxID=55291 RepID=UPI001963C035|nr:uncharacterized protein LOC120528972 [Polypterus senegalus]
MAPKKQVGVETPDRGHGVDSSTAQATEDTTSTGDIRVVETLLRQFIAVQEDKDRRLEHRFKSLQHQFTQLQGQVDLVQQSRSQVSEEPAERSRGSPVRIMDYPRLMPFAEPEDIEHYLTTFERMATVCGWPKSEWAVRLVPLLTGRARAAFLAMPAEESLRYDSLKGAILEKFEISTETYRIRFRSVEWEHGQSPKELLALLKELCTKWLQPDKHTVDQIIDFVLLEQLLQVFDGRLRTWVEEHRPKTSKEAADLAEVFLAAHRPRNLRREDKVSMKPRPMEQPKGMSRVDTGRGPVSAVHLPERRVYREEVICYGCNQKGHIHRNCPKKRETKLCFEPCPLPTKMTPLVNREKMVRVAIAGRQYKALIDTGSTQSLVRRECLEGQVVESGRA